MNSINHIRLGVERIFFIISLVLVFGFTVIIANHYKVDLFIGKPLMYLLYYLIAMLAPLLISQILLWVIYGFKGIPFRLMLTRKFWHSSSLSSPLYVLSTYCSSGLFLLWFLTML